MDFERPRNSLRLKAAWDTLHKLNFGVFSQLIIVPLLNEHRILAQVAGYHTEVIKFLPSLVVTEEDMEWFLSAMDCVLADLEQVQGTAWNTMASMAKGALRAVGS